MPSTASVMEAPSAPASFDLDATIKKCVRSSGGIKDTDLTRMVLDNVVIRGNPIAATTAVSGAIHSLILSGQLVGIDCETPEGAFTMVLPPLSTARIAIPIQVKNVKTVH